MDKFINLLYVFFNGDFFVVIIVALILILSVVLVGLIKVQKENERLIEESNALKENVVKEVEEDVKEKEEVLVEANVEKNINEAIVKEEPAKEENIEKTEEVIEEVKEELEKPLEEEILEIKEENKEEDVINPIEAYEQDEEANAVISTKELESIEKERNELYGAENNAKLIEEYETDQENKAIISYSELLKNAQGLELEYIEKPKEDDNAPVVKQVELKNQQLKGVNYAAEEEYLRILKEFRNDLIANG